jgi:phosphoglycerol geranylgeranyltransferase
MIYPHILQTLKTRKLFILLIDPDKEDNTSLGKLLDTAGQCNVDLLLVGGSLISAPLDEPLAFIRSKTSLPVVLFPGSLLQVSPHADGILLLSLISGRNPEYLIGNHVIAAPLLKHSGLEIIPTGYILVENGRSTSVEYISQTKPIPADKMDIATATAMAGEMLGLKLLYLEAGSGAMRTVPAEIVRSVKQNTSIPLFVGGGIRTPGDVKAMYDAGADAVVVGTAVEHDPEMLCPMASVPRK